MRGRDLNLGITAKALIDLLWRHRRRVGERHGERKSIGVICQVALPVARPLLLPGARSDAAVPGAAPRGRSSIASFVVLRILPGKVSGGGGGGGGGRGGGGGGDWELEQPGECGADGDVAGSTAAEGSADGEWEEAELRGLREEESGGARIYGEHSLSWRNRQAMNEQ